MKQFLLYFLITIFSIFIGSQITEGVLLVPFWQSLPSADFYSYYSEFGPSIGLFYSVLTIIAAIIPIFLAVYCWKTKSNGLSFAVISSIFAILFVSCFYVYFRDTNDLFYESAFSDIELKKELVTWSYWHWGRILVEFASLTFLILAIIRIQKNNGL